MIDLIDLRNTPAPPLSLYLSIFSSSYAQLFANVNMYEGMKYEGQEKEIFNLELFKKDYLASIQPRPAFITNVQLF